MTWVQHLPTPEGDDCQCHILRGCSWYGRRGDEPGKDGQTPQDGYTVRIPEELLPEGNLPQAGDYMVRGPMAQYTGVRCLNGEDYFRVGSVGDNRRGVHLRHIVVKDGV